ncbi:MAG: hypothetical protein LIP16_09870 [Clostridium sp.]|nr:hypothetical protein [Clostridium sp.]
MGKKYSVWITAAVVGLWAAGITACGLPERGAGLAAETAAEKTAGAAGPAETAEESGTGAGNLLGEENKAEAVAEKGPEGGIPVEIFYGDDNGELILSKEMFVTDVDQQELVRCLVEAGILEDGTEVLTLERREDKKGVYLDVDFNGKFTEKLNRMGTSGERIYMGSVVNTFLTAFEADFMMVTSGGRTIESGHAIYDEYQGPYERSAERTF